ncbi:DNA repair protein XRCC1-like isoform X2 [Thrips palmi]|uniref:DNA repair protein XRCC1-like isoform X2 n=1 Tax=Thrips palmi TaxID=161013 RepID=A0A6P8YNB8_THRPL|nr:DNA repair protein XRCC1-like isoform X2 [Thrips palmi]
MPQAKFDRIVSCSSEDPAYPSKNLLLGRKWRSKEAGEEKETVIIQLSEPYNITGIDIGNESSAFVEVLVSRTSSPDDFKVLLVMSSFMTPMDARAEANKNRVRMFARDSLSDPERKEKWDRIKVVCTQPFNKHMQYGLSFIKLHTSDSKEEPTRNPNTPVKALGRFTLKDEEESDFSLGSFFSRRKDLQASPSPAPAPLTGAAAVRDASSPANLAQQKPPLKRKGSDDLTDSQKKKKGRPKKDDPDTSTYKDTNDDVTDSQKKKKDKPKKDEDTEAKPGKNKSPSKEKPKKDLDDSNENSPKLNIVKKKPVSTDQPKHRAATDIASTSKASQNSQKASNEKRSHITYKPFAKLLEDVEIVISGYQNPGRAHIRDKALAMGSKYCGDWRSSSTHLICAFTNTPKLQQLQSQGVNAIVVSRDWVDDCYSERKKLPWRSYALLDKDKRNSGGTPEPEVWELIPGMDINHDSPLPPVSRRNNIATQDTRLKSDSEDSEDEIQRIKAKQNMQKKKVEERKNKDLNGSISKNNKRSIGSDSSDSEDEIKRVKAKQDLKKKQLDDESKKTKDLKGKTSDDAYNCSTDADSEEEAKIRLAEWSKAQMNKSPLDDLPPLADFFKDKTFFLSTELPEKERQSLCRYIVAFGGDLLESEDKPAHFIISRFKIGLCDS